ncbi:hypothetical protein FQS90_12345 [Enterococcus casseliflavus]|uniref:hypothetical protein n=1 Tax=Enterococcus sp. 8E11_MSG4843 TaxID=1834190 RepID=UPI000B3EC01C|nr:hypothetical protein [Enterococcus sp. 8E11_MSG4843]MBO1097309.1 hypothetical protein [Enterococcus casseliflavus]MBO1144434.1 hypothetical protein [Enterococcus casseliflavus]OUZ36126.1 hypothetical protein A5885_000311 [Enterococcus sp. 8E11_MSG4843]
MQENKLHQHLKKIVCQHASRPALQCVQYHEDGSLRATDSHVMLRINDFHTIEQTLIQNVRTLEFKDLKYPDTDSHFVKKNNPNKLRISLSVFKRILTALKEGSFSNIVTLHLNPEKVEITNNQSNSEVPISIIVGCKYEGESMEISFSAENLLKMVNFMLDAKQRYAVDDIDIFIGSVIRPVIAELEEGKYQFIVTPVRTR